LICRSTAIDACQRTWGVNTNNCVAALCLATTSSGTSSHGKNELGFWNVSTHIFVLLLRLKSLWGTVLQASNDPAGTSLQLCERLSRARAIADKARAGHSSAENEYRAAVDRAFGMARQNFK
jgi:hypothetical protein